MLNLTWASPSTSIQNGIAAAVSGDAVIVASGTYFEIVFMANGVSVFGAG